MANLVIVPNDVKRSQPSGSFRPGKWGEAIYSGQAVWLNQSDNRWYLTDSSTVLTPENVTRFGIALTSGSAEQDGIICVGNTSVIYLGTNVLRSGDVIVLDSNVKGGLKPIADVVTGEYLTIVGYASSESELTLDSTVTLTQVNPPSKPPFACENNTCSYTWTAGAWVLTVPCIPQCECPAAPLTPGTIEGEIVILTCGEIIDCDTPCPDCLPTPAKVIVTELQHTDNNPLSGFGCMAQASYSLGTEISNLGCVITHSGNWLCGSGSPIPCMVEITITDTEVLINFLDASPVHTTEYAWQLPQAGQCSFAASGPLTLGEAATIKLEVVCLDAAPLSLQERNERIVNQAISPLSKQLASEHPEWFTSQCARSAFKIIDRWTIALPASSSILNVARTIANKNKDVPIEDIIIALNNLIRSSSPQERQGGSS